jgi:quercetin dioxygenase-like cupin family protein
MLPRLLITAALALALALGALVATTNGASSQPTNPAVATAGMKPVKNFPLAEFPAIGLPAGPAIVQPVHLIFPSGLVTKHTHGGPTYVYVIRGLLQVSDEKGTKTYRTGGFFWERTGWVHTLRVLKDTEVFSLRFVPPGTPGTVEAK